MSNMFKNVCMKDCCFVLGCLSQFYFCLLLTWKLWKFRGTLSSLLSVLTKFFKDFLYTGLERLSQSHSNICFACSGSRDAGSHTRLVPNSNPKFSNWGLGIIFEIASPMHRKFEMNCASRLVALGCGFAGGRCIFPDSPGSFYFFLC